MRRQYSFSILAGISVAVLMGSSAQAALVISDKATSNVTCDSGVCTATAKQAVLNVTDLTTMLASGSVIVESGAQAKDITVNAPFSWTSSNALTLDADKSLTVNKAVADTGPAALTLSYGKKGDLRFGPKGNISFTSTANSLTINKKAYTLVDSIASLASAVAKKPSGLYALAHNYDASKDGTYTASPIATPLTGTFEGLGNVVYNLSIATGKSQHPVGFISVISGIVRDFGVTSVSVQAVNYNIGMLAGEIDEEGAVYNAFASGKITLRSMAGFGGLVGLNDGVIQNSHADVEIKQKGNLNYLGGLVGGNYGVIKSSFASADVNYGDSYSGALLGVNFGQVLDCYASGFVDGEGPTGGLVGGNTGSISASYSSGRVKGNYDAGGLIGVDGSSTGDLVDNYWDLDTSGINDPSQGAGNVRDDPGIMGLTDAELKSGLPNGFDPKIWAEDTKINNGYPYLINNPPAE